MLVCDCGWTGINLVPNFITDTALCPKCYTTFGGIPAKNARSVSFVAERDLITEFQKLLLTANIFEEDQYEIG